MIKTGLLIFGRVNCNLKLSIYGGGNLSFNKTWHNATRNYSENLNSISQFSKFEQMAENLSPEMQQKRRIQDQLIITRAEDMRVSVLNNTNLVRKIQQVHELSETSTVFMGRAATAASILAGSLKGDERVLLNFENPEHAYLMSVEAQQNGELRAYTSHPKYRQPLGMSQNYALSNGVLHVRKVMYGHTQEQRYAIPMSKCDISSEIQTYYDKFENVDTIVLFETLIDYQSQIAFSGGIVVEQMRTSSIRHHLEEIRSRLDLIPQLSAMFCSEKNSLKQVAQKILLDKYDDQFTKKILLDFYCRCSKTKIMKNLSKLDRRSIDKILYSITQEDSDKSLKCNYCNKNYTLDEECIKMLAS